LQLAIGSQIYAPCTSDSINMRIVNL